MKCFLTISVLLFSCSLSAQKISGKVKDESRLPMPFVTVALHMAKDSSLVKTAVTDNEGIFAFVLIPKGSYYIVTSRVGYTPVTLPSFDLKSNQELSLPDAPMFKKPSTLKKVVVSARKPLVEVVADKLILNVESSINSAGKNALELLRTAPAVNVDQDDNISLGGQSGVQIYIDGRPSPLNAKDLGAYLRTIPSSAIETIEIINNPSAKYEAAGTGGIINIKLKRNKIYGTNGTLNAQYSLGTFSKYVAGLSLNHRNAKLNIYSNYSYTHALNLFVLNVNRTLSDTTFDSQSEKFTYQNIHRLTAGLDYFIGKKSTIGFMLDGGFSNDSVALNDGTTISYAPTKVATRRLISENANRNSSQNSNYNINYHYEDSLGRRLDMDANYGSFRYHSNQYQPNLFYDPSLQNLIAARIYNMITPSRIDIYNYKTDYEQNFKKGRLGIGAKTSFVKSDNFFNLYNYDNNKNKYFDSSQFNHFLYKENINALYANYGRSLKKIQLQFGLRLEQTHTSGRSNGYYKSVNGTYIPGDSSFSRQYLNLFPSGAITFTRAPRNQWTISYSRRINRPSYQNLNPFETRINEYGGFKGNPNLRAEYANSASITYIFNSLVSSISYNHTKNAIVSLSDTVDLVKSHYIPSNLGSIDNFRLAINYSFNRKWYSMVTNVSAYRTHNYGNLGTGRIIDLKVYAANVSLANDFQLGQGWTGSLSVYYTTPWLFRGTMKAKNQLGIDAGLQKKIIKGSGLIRVTATDISKTMVIDGTSHFAGQDLRAYAYQESRQLRVSFNYRFGSTKIKGSRQRKTGLEEERQRSGAN